MGLAEILTVLFIALKLLGAINWSWWLVLLPEIIAFVFYAVVIVLKVFLDVKEQLAEKELFKK